MSHLSILHGTGPDLGTLPRAILFDLDDTILSFGESAEEVWGALSQRYAPRIDGLEADSLPRTIRDYAKWYWSDPQRHRKGRLHPDVTLHIVTGALRSIGAEAPMVAHEMAETYSTRRERSATPSPGAVDTLRHLRGEGVRLALVTNGNADRQRRKVETHGLGPLFDYVLIEGEFGLGKPDERVYRYALSRTGTPPGETRMVGDNLEWEVVAPQRLGMAGIWVDAAGAGLPESSEVTPDRIIRSMPELLEPPS